jgi:hypothetical protein
LELEKIGIFGIGFFMLENSGKKFPALATGKKKKLDFF